MILEFLEPNPNIDEYMIIKAIERILGIKMVSKYAKQDNYYIIPGYSFIKIKNNDKIKNTLQSIAETYFCDIRIYEQSYYNSICSNNENIRFTDEDAIIKIFMNTELVKLRPKISPDSIFNNLYIHGGYVAPEIAYRTGIRLKDNTNRDISKLDYDEQALIFYNRRKTFLMRFHPHENRIYMSALALCEDIDGKNLDTVSLRRYIYGNGYGKYSYLIKLPDSYPIIEDPEAHILGGDEDWCFTTHSILPEYILYVSYHEDYLSIVPTATREDIKNFVYKGIKPDKIIYYDKIR